MLIPKKYSLASDKLFVKNVAHRGKGIFTRAPIKKGEIVIVFGGYAMTREEHEKLPRKMWPFAYNITDDIFFGIQKGKELSIVEHLNHSCNPNCGFKGDLRMVAMRNIKTREAVTTDYALLINTHDKYFKCECGDRNCRKVIKHTDWKIPVLQQKYKGYFTPYVQEKIDRLTYTS